MEALLEYIDWSVIQGVLVFVLPLLISWLKKFIPSLDGQAAYWWTLVLQILAGVLAWLTGVDPSGLTSGAFAGWASVGVYEGDKRIRKALAARKNGQGGK